MTFIKSSLVALALVAILIYGTHNAYAYGGNQTSTGNNFRHNFFPHLGINIGLGHFRDHFVNPSVTVSPPSTTVTTTPAPVSTSIRHHDFNRFHDWAFAHREHFLFLNNQYVLLPEAIGCPVGTSLVGNECVIVQPTIVAQEAPQIQTEIVQAPPVVTETQVQTTSVAPTISCPTGATLQPDNTCTVTTESQQTVQAIVTCPVGTSLSGGQCIQQQQQIVVDPLPCPQCPPGAGLVNGQCVVSTLPSQVTVGSLPGEIIVLGHHFHHNGLLPFLR